MYYMWVEMSEYGGKIHALIKDLIDISPILNRNQAKLIAQHNYTTEVYSHYDIIQ